MCWLRRLRVSEWRVSNVVASFLATHIAQTGATAQRLEPGVQERVRAVLRQSQTCSPHSVLFLPAQRPARGSSPGAVARVHGAQPIEV
jgi:hypothetical protein